jgi:hypothetical protein
MPKLNLKELKTDQKDIKLQLSLLANEHPESDVTRTNSPALCQYS